MKEGSPRALRNYRSITPLRRKIEIAEEFGFDVAYAIKFNSEFSQTTSKDFIRKYIVDVFNPNVVIVGYDWSFGRGREGTPETLKEYGKAFGFDVKVVEPVALDGVRVSSSEIRQALSVPDLKLCKKLLGRDFDVSGVVRQGAKIGRTIGFPTANIKPGRSLLPPFGVYITTTHIDGVVHNSVTNIGKRPSVGGDEVLLETHILDDHPYELYGSRIRISLLSFLRGEERFANLEQLRKQIAKDVELAKRFHSERSS
jgi:riboflavin kinase/FMN adenylyltransferase